MKVVIWWRSKSEKGTGRALKRLGIFQVVKFVTKKGVVFFFTKGVPPPPDTPDLLPLEYLVVRRVKGVTTFWLVRRKWVVRLGHDVTS